MEVLIRKEQQMKTNYRMKMKNIKKYQINKLIPSGQTLWKLESSAELLKSLCIVLATLFLVSCEKKDLCEWVHPHDSKICHTELTLKLNTAWESEGIGIPYAKSANADFSIRYIVEFWKINEEGKLESLIERKEVKGQSKEKNITQTISVDLPAFKVTVLCWAEKLSGNAATNPNFDTTNLIQVKLNPFTGRASDKDAFTASATWDYTIHGYERNGIKLTESITLLRPFGHYTLTTDDVKEYKKQQGINAPLPATTKVEYQLWVPGTFDVFRQIASNPIAGVTYNYTTTSIDEDNILLNEDCIFIGTADNSENYFNLVVSTYAADGTKIRQSGNVEFKLQRNKHTNVSGAFLTKQSGTMPGIDDSFDDETEVVIPD